MTILTIDLYDFGADFKRDIKNLGITVLDKSDPIRVQLEGDRDKLIEFYNSCKTEGNPEDFLSEPEAPAVAITWLNQSGDVTITWDKENEEAMLQMIEAKMKDGYSFFIIKPRMLGIFGVKPVLAKSIKQIRKAGSVVADDSVFTGARPKLYDAEVEQAVQSGKAKMAKPTTQAKETVRRATSAAEVVRNQSVAIRPIVGG